jgi:AcrR family transcriptional regulator
MTSNDVRASLLDAAVGLLLSGSAKRLTVAGVAAAAGLSKGGALHHFPTKRALIEALIASALAAFEADFQASADRDPEAAGRWTRAFVSASIPVHAGGISPLYRMTAAINAAVAEDSTLLAPLRARYAVWQARFMADGIDPVAATLVRLAVDGLWLSEVSGIANFEPSFRHDLLTRLEDLSRSPHSNSGAGSNH